MPVFWKEPLEADRRFFPQVDFADTSVIVSEPLYNFSSIQESMNEILFEEYQFQSVLRINGGASRSHRTHHPSLTGRIKHNDSTSAKKC